MKKYAIAGLLPVILIALTACGQSAQPADAPSQVETAGEGALWMTEGFAVSGKLKEEQALWAGQYLPWEHKSQNTAADAEELAWLDCGVCGELFWYLGRERGTGADTQVEYILEIYDTVSEESTVKPFSSGDLGLEGEWCLLYSMDMLDKEHYVFRWANHEQDEEGMYHQTADGMIYTDLEGSLQTINFRDIYLEKGIHREELTEQPFLQALSWCCDGKGNICVTDYQEDGSFRIYLFDQGGESLLEHEGTREQWLVNAMCTPEGELVFPVYDNKEKCYAFMWVDAEGRELRSLGRIEAAYPDIRQVYGMQGQDIYYRSQDMTGDWLVRWDTGSGSRVRVLDFQTAGISTGYDIMLALRKGQTPVLHLSKTKDEERREWLSVLMEQEPSYDDAIRVADLAVAGEPKAQVAACAVLASIESPGFHYKYEDAAAQENRDRILVELSQGQGPDLMFVSLEDMYLLEEKGLLLDIGELVSQELREELLPGALEIGVVDGRLLGMPVAIQADTLVAAGDTWEADTWRLEDVIGLMEEGRLIGAVRNFPNMMMGKYMEPFLSVNMLIKYSLGDSFLIDWDNRVCHFDDERFIRLLELTGADLSKTPVDADVWLNEGRDVLWGYFKIEADFLDFFAHMEKEGGRIVGYPTEDACGSYLTASSGVLVVNANIAHKEAAACFLELLLGEELQAKKYAWCMSVRRLCPEDYIVEDEWGRAVYLGGENASEVPVFDDGTTALHRAETFLESCVAAPREYSQITRILSEELSAMYAEGKSPGATAEVINSRVQIYLDEGY